jgi:hypothetical protein
VLLELRQDRFGISAIKIAGGQRIERAPVLADQVKRHGVGAVDD